MRIDIKNLASEISYITLLSLKTHKKFFFTLSVVLFFINLITPFIIQLILTRSFDILYGYYLPPKDIQYPSDINTSLPIFWIAIKYSSYFASTGIVTKGDTYWVIIYDVSTVLLSIVSSLVTSIVFTHIRFYSSKLKGKCSVEKGASALGATLATIGFSAISTSAVSCPSCGFTVVMTLAAVFVSATTGSLLGISSVYTALMNTLLLIGILINIGIIVYIDGKIIKILNLNV